MVHTAGRDTTTTTAMETAIAELLVGHSTTTLLTSQVGCLRTCPHKRLGSNGRLKHSYTMIFTRPTLFYKRKRIACGYNYILSHSRRNRVKLTFRLRVVAAQSNSRPRIAIAPVHSISHLSQHPFVQTCSSTLCTTRDNRFMDTKHRARTPHRLL